MMEIRTVMKVGIIDVSYPLTKYEYTNGKKKRVWVCPFYSRWINMLNRCYSETKPTYEDCEVCKEWLTFSNFKRWMELQNWENMELDKDYVFKGNKLYSPDTCFFISHITNNFMLDNSSRSNSLTGTWYDPKREMYESKCRNPLTNKREFLGRFDTELEAHNVWKKRKHEIALMLSEEQTFEQVKTRLINEYKG